MHSSVVRGLSRNRVSRGFGAGAELELEGDALGDSKGRTAVTQVKVSKLEIARWAMTALPARIQGEGRYCQGNAVSPSHWILDLPGFTLLFTKTALRLPTDPGLSSMVDIFAIPGRKVLSVSWFPTHPWLPPEISRYTNGDWTARLGWTPLPQVCHLGREP